MSGNEGEINTSERRAEDRLKQEQGQQSEGPGGSLKTVGVDGHYSGRGTGDFDRQQAVNQMKSRIDDSVGKQARDEGALIEPTMRRRIQAELMQMRHIEHRASKLSVLLVLIDKNPEVVQIISLMQELGFIR